MSTRITLQLALIVTSAVTLSAHHAVRQVYDAAAVVPLAGVVTSAQIVNPHVTVSLEATGPDGRVSTWVVEMAPPGVLKRKEFDFQLLTAGRQVVVEAWLRKDGQTGQATGRTLVLPDGRRLDVGDNWDGSMNVTAK